MDLKPVTSVFVGEGAYVGWTAVVGVSALDTQLHVDGIIFEGDVPPAPDMAEAGTRIEA